MKILKYTKKGKNKYKLTLDNNLEIILYEDIILNNKLLITKEINNLELLSKENEKYSLYDKVLSYINKKMRCEKEIKNYLQKYTDDFHEIDNIINKLKSNHYINDELYIKSFINDKINLSMDGPLKIKKDLECLGFNTFDIEDKLQKFDEDLNKKKIEKYIFKQLKQKKKSIYMFKQKMLVNLVNLGYLKEDIFEILNKVEINEDSLKEKEREKLIKKYSKKYTGLELEKIIKQKLYEKGYFD